MHSFLVHPDNMGVHGVSTGAGMHLDVGQREPEGAERAGHHGLLWAGRRDREGAGNRGHNPPRELPGLQPLAGGGVERQVLCSKEHCSIEKEQTTGVNTTVDCNSESIYSMSYSPWRDRIRSQHKHTSAYWACGLKVTSVLRMRGCGSVL